MEIEQRPWWDRPGPSIEELQRIIVTLEAALKESRYAEQIENGARIKAEAECRRLENRHVQFMVEGGPVVMATDFEAMKAERDEWKAKAEHRDSQWERAIAELNRSFEMDPRATAEELATLYEFINAPAQPTEGMF